MHEQIANPAAIYLEQKKQTEKNRRKVEGNGAPLRANNITESLNSDLPSGEDKPVHYGSGLEKKAKGGIAMTVFPAPNGYEQPNISGVSQNMIREASRSGSRKRYPFMDSEPFQGNHPPNRSRSSKERRYS